MRTDQVAAWISEPRFRSYLEASDGDYGRGWRDWPRPLGESSMLPVAFVATIS